MVFLKNALILAIFALTLSFAQSSFIDPETPQGVRPVNNIPGSTYQLVFSDEFNDTVIDPLKWSIQNSSKTRNPRPKLSIDDWWWKTENAYEEKGKLVLRVVKHDHNTMYCGSINSNNKFEATYGYYEVRLKIADPRMGTHTAFWFQGDHMSNVDGTANDGAEIDVFESAWLNETTKSVLHIDGYGDDHKANTKSYNVPGLNTGYHTFALHWTKDWLKIYYNGEIKVTYSNEKWRVHVPEYIWLSDGASFGIQGDYFTKRDVGTLTHAYVDYVRVWHYDPDLVATPWPSSSSEVVSSSSDVLISSSDIAFSSSVEESSSSIISSSFVESSSSVVWSSIGMSSSSEVEVSSEQSSSSLLSSSSESDVLSSSSDSKISSSSFQITPLSSLRKHTTYKVQVINGFMSLPIPDGAKRYIVYSLNGEMLESQLLNENANHIVLTHLRQLSLIEFR